MPTLLVLGSKPQPALPPARLIDAVGCANASGFSAAEAGLPRPDYTLMTAVLTSGKASDDHSLQALRGLSTRRLFVYPRPRFDAAGPGRASLTARLKGWRMSPWWMRRRLRALDYRWDEMIVRPAAWYHNLVLRLAGGGEEVGRVMAHKQPSTGLAAVALGLADERFDRVVMAGFDFTLSHAYGTNPLIADRGVTASKHADTDVGLLMAWVACGRPLLTTEPAVHARAGVPRLGS
jgi:hypothetical protein